MAEKTTAFTGPVVVGLNDKKGEIRLTDGKNVNEAKYLAIAAPDTLTSNTTLTFPNSVGTNGQFLKTDGNGDLTWSTPDTGGIAAVVDDTAPELGGDLASNGHDIDFADGDKAKFGNSGDLEIFHDGTNSLIKDVGTGQLKISGFDAVKITNGDDTVPSAQFISSGEAQLYYAGSQKLAANTDGITVTGKVVSDGLEVDGDIKLDGNYPTGTDNVALGNTALDSINLGANNTAIGANALTGNTNGSQNTAVGTDALQTGGNNSNTAIGRGALRFCTGNSNTALGVQAGSTFSNGTNCTIIGASANASSGNATNEITLGNIDITSLRIPGLQSGASTNDVLTFNGTDITLATPSGGGGGGISWQPVITSSPLFAVSASQGFFVNTSGGAITLNLPATPTQGDEVAFVDYAGTAATNNITIGRNGENIQGSASDLIINTNRAGNTLVYVDATQGWLLKNV